MWATPDTMLAVLLTVLVISAFAALMIWKGAPLLAHRLIYKPERGAHDQRRPIFPDDVNHEDLFFKTDDGETLHGWLVSKRTPPEAPPLSTSSSKQNAVLLICHGNRGSIANREDTALFYLELGLDVCLFDYRGYGKSTGKTTESGTYHDVDAAWAHLLSRGYAPNQIILLGRSLGAAIASHLASETQPAAVILESTFSTLADLAAELYPWLRRLFNVHIRYDTLSKIPKINSPLLLVHSVDDELIGIHHGQALLKAAPENTRMIKINGRHRDGFATSKAVYLPAIRAFIEEHLGR